MFSKYKIPAVKKFCEFQKIDSLETENKRATDIYQVHAV